MTTSPRPRRGDTNPLRPGLLFWAMAHGKEWWVTPEKFEHHRQAKNAFARKAGKTPEGRRKGREASKKRSKLPHVRAYQAAFQRKKRHIYSPRSRAWRRAYKKMRLATDPQYRIAHNLSVSMRRQIKLFGGRKSSGAQSLLGCTKEFFRGWLESQFTDGMTWDNYGTFWTVDHIRPVVGFDLLTKEGQKAAYHYTNCQPLIANQNNAKCDRIEFEGRTVRAGHLRKQKIIPFIAAQA